MTRLGSGRKHTGNGKVTVDWLERKSQNQIQFWFSLLLYHWISHRNIILNNLFLRLRISVNLKYSVIFKGTCRTLPAVLAKKAFPKPWPQTIKWGRFLTNRAYADMETIGGNLRLLGNNIFTWFKVRSFSQVQVNRKNLLIFFI